MAAAIRRAVLAVCAAASLGLGSCDPGSRKAPETGEQPQLQVVEVADVPGRIRALGGGPLIVNYWATWCIPCLAEMPDLLAGTREFRERGGAVVTVALERQSEGQSIDDIAAKVRATMERLSMDVPVLVCIEDDLLAVRRALGFDLGGLPQTLAYDRRGEVAAHHEGVATREEFAELARLAERP